MMMMEAREEKEEMIALLTYCKVILSLFCLPYFSVGCLDCECVERASRESEPPTSFHPTYDLLLSTSGGIALKIQTACFYLIERRSVSLGTAFLSLSGEGGNFADTQAKIQN